MVSSFNKKIFYKFEHNFKTFKKAKGKKNF